ncbi:MULTISPECIES: Cna B-type domain-containing protein, partial [Sphingobacterium]|uniref:DUF7507 domain-containing protein n=1 Tax=Sphingobacterium TaxID=28453 RepID=UPI0013DC42D4
MKSYLTRWRGLATFLGSRENSKPILSFENGGLLHRASNLLKRFLFVKTAILALLLSFAFSTQVKGQCTYNIDPNATVVDLVGISTNDLTIASKLWKYNNTIYVAVKSKLSIQSMTIEGITSFTKDECPVGMDLTINTTPSATVLSPVPGLSGGGNGARWTVVQFDYLTLLQELQDGQNTISVKGNGGGHDVNNVPFDFVVPKIDVPVFKNWVGGGSNYPTINVALYGTEAGGITPRLLSTYSWQSIGSSWSHTFLQVPKYGPSGSLYTYSVDEDPVIGYCKSISGLTITNTKIVVASAGSDQVKCNDGNFTLAGNNPGTSSGLWTVVGTAPSGFAFTNATLYNTTVTGLPAGSSITLRWTVTTGTCSTSDDVILTNNAAPAAPTALNGGTITVCASSPLQTLNANDAVQTVSGQNIVWYDAEVGGNIVATPTLNAVGSRILWAEATTIATGCTSTSRTKVTLTIHNCSIALVKKAVVNNTGTNGCTVLGDQITYTFEVTNPGTSDISSITITDPLFQAPNPSVAISYVSGDSNSDSKLNQGEIWIYTAEYTITQANINSGSITNQATVQGVTSTGSTVMDQSGTAVNNNTQTVTTLCQSPDFTITKTADVSTYDAVGDVITYTITVTNTGNVTLNNVSVVD